jgi:predicted DNA-binding protein
VSDFSFDSGIFPKKIELRLSDEVAEWLRDASARTGRSEAELLLELLDRGLQTF